MSSLQGSFHPNELLIPYSKRRAVLRPHLAAVVEAGGGDVSVAEPLLDLGNIGFMGEGAGGGRGAQRMHAEAVHFSADAGFEAVFQDDVAVDRGGVERAVE